MVEDAGLLGCEGVFERVAPDSSKERVAFILKVKAVQG